MRMTRLQKRLNLITSNLNIECEASISELGDFQLKLNLSSEPLGAVDIVGPVADTNFGVKQCTGWALVSSLWVAWSGGSNAVVKGSASVHWSVDISCKRSKALK